MHTLKLPLKLDEYSLEMIEKAFATTIMIHNEIVAHCKKLLRVCKRNKRYKYALKKYRYYKDLLDKLSLPDPAKVKSGELTNQQKKILASATYYEQQMGYFSNEMTEIRESIGLTKNAIEKWAARIQDRYDHILKAHQVQKEADRVWAGVYTVLFRNGKDIHFKKGSEFRTIGQKNNVNGAVFDPSTMTVVMNKMVIPVVFKDDRTYHYKTAALQGKIKMCEIERHPVGDSWRYYVNIYIEGPAPLKLTPGKGTMGIDPGVSSEAIDCETYTDIHQLAPDVKKYDRAIRHLQQNIDREKRLLNPDNYNEDGTIKKGHHKWIKSKTLRCNEWKLTQQYFKKSAYIKQSHEEYLNTLIPLADHFRYEKMDFRALAKRAGQKSKNDRAAAAKEKSDKYITITKKDGTQKVVRKDKRKKRFGPSINNRAPGLFLLRLTQKCKQYGLKCEEVNTRTMKASQYNHTNGECEKVPLKQRMKEIGGMKVQRDMYSAYIIRNAKSDLQTPNQKKCAKGFDAFVKRQNAAIERIIASGVERPSCFGF